MRKESGSSPSAGESLATCIYCLQEKPLSAFNEEHVIPQSFGADMVLEHTVCEVCNSLFGRKLDEFLGRDSFEGILRYKFGIAEPPHKKKGQRFKPRRVLISITKQGEWKGALLEFRGFDANGALDCDLAPQAALRRMIGGELKHFHIDNMPDKAAAEREGFDTKQVQAAGPNAESRLDVVRRLKSLGYEAKEWKEGPSFPADTVPLEVLATIDETIKRTVAKVLFNYLAKMHGATFVLSEDFNGIRDYILKGTKPDWEFFQTSNEPILADDFPGLRQTDAHLIVVEWDEARKGINGRLSLFNTTTHRVRLCHNYRGIYREIRSGHSFNPKTGEMKELLGADKRIRVARLTPRGMLIR